MTGQVGERTIQDTEGREITRIHGELEHQCQIYSELIASLDVRDKYKANISEKKISLDEVGKQQACKFRDAVSACIARQM